MSLRMSARMCIHMSVRMSIRMSMHMSIHTSVHMAIHMSARMSKTRVYAHIYAQAVERHPMNRVFALKDLVDILRLTHKNVYPKLVSNAQVCRAVYGGRHAH